MATGLNKQNKKYFLYQINKLLIINSIIMKKVLFIVAILIGFAGVANAQVDGKAIGLRFGYGAELSYQHPLSDANRVELGLGLASWAGGVYLNGAYHWVKDLSSVMDGMNWYFGGGLTLGVAGGGFGLGVIGQAGVEYDFELGSLPLQASLDWRPAIYVVPTFAAGLAGVGVSIRYKF
jgi:F0F1-type ATP synthase membrane subunit c/vacuolar-type H+-ATPase subunit K